MYALSNTIASRRLRKLGLGRVNEILMDSVVSGT